MLFYGVDLYIAHMTASFLLQTWMLLPLALFYVARLVLLADLLHMLCMYHGILLLLFLHLIVLPTLYLMLPWLLVRFGMLLLVLVVVLQSWRLFLSSKLVDYVCYSRQ